ncbi:MAG: hypothetical protein Q9222_002211 [Ikaeria aurantiellina]
MSVAPHEDGAKDDDWEIAEGVFRTTVMPFNEQTGRGDPDLVVEVPDGIILHDDPEGRFRFAAIRSPLRSFTWGILELQPGQVKPRCGTHWHHTLFSILKGRVTIGNYYTVTNSSSTNAKIAWTKACGENESVHFGSRLIATSPQPLPPVATDEKVEEGGSVAVVTEKVWKVFNDCPPSP